MAGAGLLAMLLVVGAACLTTGCSTLGYYAQAASGHLDLLRRARPVAEVVAAPETPAALRDRLMLSQQMRDFAETRLLLPRNGSYRRYADLQRSAAVWNVVATPELSLALKTWCFPVMGCVGYRGYYDKSAAEALAAELNQQGMETRVYGVPAYSTLGYSSWLGGDPLLNTFIQGNEIELAQQIFHELAHQVVYAADDTTFNESFATSVERIGGQLWLQQHNRPGTQAAMLAWQQRAARQKDFRELTRRYREQLQALYDSGLPDTDKRRDKATLMAALQADYTALKTQRWGGYAGYDTWFASANNASFAVLAAYNQLVPAFERLYEQQGRDLGRFYAAVQRLADLPKDQRMAVLVAEP